MRRWHEERELMIRRWRIEVETHDGIGAQFPPVATESSCHCFRGMGTMRKTKPLDCGNPRCSLCHWEKFHEPKRRGATIRAAIASDLAAG